MNNMNNSRISLIAAIGRNRELGKDGKLPWSIPEDLKYFHDQTRGKPMIMGRKTYEAIGRALPDRTNIVITRQRDYAAPGCMVTASLDEALALAARANPVEIMIIGGAEIFRQAMSRADKIYLTVIDAAFPADTWFPDYSEFKKVVAKKEYDNGEYKFAFLELER